MYYKIENKESEVYQKLHKMRSEELVFEEENKKAIIGKSGLTFDKYFGNAGQQNFRRVTEYTGLVFNEVDKIDPKTWKQHKDHSDVYVPNTRFKAGRDMRDLLNNGLKGSNFRAPLDILGLNIQGRFTFPYVEIADDVIVVYVDDKMEPEDENLIEITRKEFQEILKSDK